MNDTIMSSDVNVLIAAAAAHRICCSEEHDPANGKLAGFCVVCGLPWPCETAEYFMRPNAENSKNHSKSKANTKVHHMPNHPVVKYKYINPAPAGPFRGSVIWDGKGITRDEPPRKGDYIYMPFGSATVTSVSRRTK